MVLLSIDTCGPLGTVALARLGGDEPHISGQIDLPGKTYSAQLVPAIRELLSAHNVPAAAIEALIVTHGPGSFTGIRIALATVKGLAEAHAIPIVAVSRLAVLAHKAGTTAAALDASRGEFYFRDASGSPEEQLLTPELFRERTTLPGDNLAVCEDSVHAAAPAATRTDPPTATDAIRCVLPRLREGDYDDPLTLDGHYLRRSDAEIFSKPKLAPTP